MAVGHRVVEGSGAAPFSRGGEGPGIVAIVHDTARARGQGDACDGKGIAVDICRVEQQRGFGQRERSILVHGAERRWATHDRGVVQIRIRAHFLLHIETQRRGLSGLGCAVDVIVQSVAYGHALSIQAPLPGVAAEANQIAGVAADDQCVGRETQGIVSRVGQDIVAPDDQRGADAGQFDPFDAGDAGRCEKVQGRIRGAKFVGTASANHSIPRPSQENVVAGTADQAVAAPSTFEGAAGAGTADEGIAPGTADNVQRQGLGAAVDQEALRLPGQADSRCGAFDADILDPGQPGVAGENVLSDVAGLQRQRVRTFTAVDEVVSGIARAIGANLVVARPAVNAVAPSPGHNGVVAGPAVEHVVGRRLQPIVAAEAEQGEGARAPRRDVGLDDISALRTSDRLVPAGQPAVVGIATGIHVLPVDRRLQGNRRVGRDDRIARLTEIERVALLAEIAELVADGA